MFSSSVRAGDERDDRRLGLLGVAHPVAVGAKAGIVQHVGMPDRTEQRRSDIAWIDAEMPKTAVLGANNVRGLVCFRAGCRCAAGSARSCRRSAPLVAITRQRVEQRQVNHLARTAFDLDAPQRHHDGKGAVKPIDHVG